MDSVFEQFSENVNADVVSSDIITPILASPGRTLTRCGLCCDIISSTVKPVNIIISDRSREIATKWSQKYIPTDYFEHKFTLPNVIKIFNKNGDKVQVHASCKPKFNTRLPRFDSFVKPIEIATDSTELQNNSASAIETCTKRPCIKTRLQLDDSVHKICFICYKNRTSDTHKYTEGGLARCESSTNVIVEKMEMHLQNEESLFFEAAGRLRMKLSCISDIYALDLYYHRSCYLNFVKTLKSNREKMYDDIFLKQQIALKEFYNKDESLVVVVKNAFLLSELLKDFINVCSFHNVEVPFDNTRSLRRKLEEKFTDDEIGFF